MSDSGQSRVLSNIVSPYGLAMISYAFFLFACFFPPSLYTYYVREPDLMFLDPTIILFYTLCVAAFVAGVWSFGKLFPPSPVVERKFEVRIQPATFLLIPLLLAVALTALSSVLLVKNNPLVIPLLLAQQGGGLRADDGSGIQLEGTLNIAVLFLNGVVWWVFWRSIQCGVRWRGRRMVQCALALALLSVFISSTLNLARHPLVVVLAGMAVAYLLQKDLARRLSWRLVGKTALVFVLGGSIFFFLVSSLRGGFSGSGQIETFVGYTIASYNRLAAVLQGRLNLEYPGRGIYFSSFLSFNHTINRIIPFGRIMNIPDYFDWWRSSFSSVGRSGLFADMIFFGTFGEIYVELGWFTPLYVFGYGLLYGLLWHWIRDGKVVGIILYPYFAFCILFWFSTNGLFDIDSVALIADAIVLGVYESVFVAQWQSSVQLNQVT